MSEVYPPPAGDEPWDADKVWDDEPVPLSLEDPDDEEVTDDGRRTLGR